MTPKIAYSLLMGDDGPFNDDSTDDQTAEPMFSKKGRKTRRRPKRLPWTIIHGAVMFMCVSISMLTIFAFRRPPENCLEKFNAYTPMLDAISEDYVDLTFKGSLFYKSPYKGPPTPEVNKAWLDLMAYGMIRITADDILRIGHNLTAVQYPPSAGGGYLGVAMGTHQLHCLYYIWRDHHIQHFPRMLADKAGVPEMYERHYEHCVDYIRQGIMCSFDPGIIPYYWVRDHNNPTPDGNTRHKCVNWDILQDWLKERAVEIPEGFEWRQPEDAVSLPNNP